MTMCRVRTTAPCCAFAAANVSCSQRESLVRRRYEAVRGPAGESPFERKLLHHVENAIARSPTDLIGERLPAG